MEVERVRFTKVVTGSKSSNVCTAKVIITNNVHLLKLAKQNMTSVVVIKPFVDSCSILCHVSSIHNDRNDIVALLVFGNLFIQLVCCCCPNLILQPIKSLLICCLIDNWLISFWIQCKCLYV